MRPPIRIAAFLLLTGAASLGHARQDPAAAPPAPGTRGNPDNVPLIGRRDPKGNPVRLAKATGHVSNYSEEKVRALHAARSPGHGERRARHRAPTSGSRRAARRSSSSTGTRSTAAFPTTRRRSPGRWPRPTPPPATARRS